MPKYRFTGELRKSCRHSTNRDSKPVCLEFEALDDTAARLKLATHFGKEGQDIEKPNLVRVVVEEQTVIVPIEANPVELLPEEPSSGIIVMDGCFGTYDPHATHAK